MKRVWIKPKARKHILGGHPWVFSGAIVRSDGEISAGDSVALYDGDTLLGSGLYNPQSQIRIRVYSYQEQPFDATYLIKQLRSACERRQILQNDDTNCYRLLNSEGDGVPGLVVDIYDRTAVMQLTTASMDSRREMIVEQLIQVLNLDSVIERSDSQVRQLEGLDPVTAVRWGTLPSELLVREWGVTYEVQPLEGQKTGLYLDQRENRLLLRRLSLGREVLNCFCYTGGFSLNALRGQASLVRSVDVSAPALHQLGGNIRRNNMDDSSHIMVKEDVFDFLRSDENYYDCIVLDPPPFVKRSDRIAQAAGAYKDINLQALKKLRPGGHLLTFSCSGHMDTAYFEEVLRWATMDSGRQASILQRLGPGLDHPRLVGHKEGEYLKGFLLQVR
ncbi:class I SAM-dependent rRNA methyltransferase [Desulfurispira natronophila]|uniref:23S rRNA (Cytosine1962-C5)-methyltransferase n=1 Tax=Desulfurispira natronophila TaxID=682562 RepID=A0A7W7Y3N3_9BACT|nr:class I SAM-dependent rRNA methyltransferase [Desulfurispira natronophila]MBB5021501.1 23S rRNA (cytosine1962-C5)-methyltransferase [Desulfurispira natronophila]